MNRYGDLREGEYTPMRKPLDVTPLSDVKIKAICLGALVYRMLDSPIEEQFWDALLNYRKHRMTVDDNCYVHMVYDDWQWWITPQMPIEVLGRFYRVDFQVKTPTEKYYIELEGHEWHGKLADQFVRDRQRDRDLTSNGYIKIPFAGREVYRDAPGCVSEMVRLVQHHG